MGEFLISIHPMLRFNQTVICHIQQSVLFQYILCYGSTDGDPTNGNLELLFQYILCYGSTPCSPSPQYFPSLFQYILCYGSTQQPLCVQLVYTCISIHPMLRFNFSFSINFHKPNYAFQYILCYGSTITVKFTIAESTDFNTSYVTVQLDSANNILCCYQISIHPMLRFNGHRKKEIKVSYRISIHPMLRFNIVRVCAYARFSSISIHPMLRFNILRHFVVNMVIYFNTSYVTVQL